MQLGETDDTMDLVIGPLEEDEVEEYRGCTALIDANDMDIETRHFTIFESETDEEEQSRLVSRFEPAACRSSRVLVGIRCGTAPRQYVHVNVQTDDTALRGLPPDLRKDAIGSCRRRNWKEDLDRMLNNIQFDLWRKGWARDITMGQCNAQPIHFSDLATYRRLTYFVVLEYQCSHHIVVYTAW